MKDDRHFATRERDSDESGAYEQHQGTMRKDEHPDLDIKDIKFEKLERKRSSTKTRIRVRHLSIKAEWVNSAIFAHVTPFANDRT